MAQQPYNGPRKAVKQNVATDFKMRLFAEPQNNSIVDNNNRPRLPWMMISFKHNQPHLTVNTNVENDKDYGKIVGAMDSFTWWAVLEAVELAAHNRLVDTEGKSVKTLSFDCMGYTFFGGKRSDAPQVKSRVIVGRNDNNEVFISVVAQGRPNIQFVFKPSEWHEVNDSNTGRPISNDLKAKLYALGYVRLMRDVSMHLLTSEYMTTEQIAAEKEANKQNRGGNGGGYQKPNNGGYQKPANNYQKPAAPAYGGDSDDDGSQEDLLW